MYLNIIIEYKMCFIVFGKQSECVVVGEILKLYTIIATDVTL
jgi:hypothetical protein